MICRIPGFEYFCLSLLETVYVMKNTLFLLFVICSFSSYAQNIALGIDDSTSVNAAGSSLSEDTIYIHDSHSSRKYFYKNMELDIREMEPLMKNNPDAYQSLMAAKESRNISNGLLIIGSGLVVGNLGYYAYKEIKSTGRTWGVDEMITPTLKIGVGLILLMIPAVVHSHYWTYKAVSQYNRSKRVRTSSSGIPLHLGVGSCGVSFSMNF